MDGQTMIVLERFTPPSFNDVGYTGGRNARRVTTASVKGMKADILPLLLAEGLPRRCAFIRADVRLVFPTRHRRDIENYRPLLAKALGDVLSPAQTREEQRLGLPPAPGWIPDDTGEFFKIGEFVMVVEPRQKRTEILLSYRLAA